MLETCQNPNPLYGTFVSLVTEMSDGKIVEVGLIGNHALTDFTWTTSLLNTNAIEITSSACNDYHSRED